LTEAFQVKGPTISHHLKVLREAGLIDCERRGTWVYYWIVPSGLAPLSQLLDPTSLAADGGGRSELGGLQNGPVQGGHNLRVELGAGGTA
jgi:ArsR family transcriptional regulator, arsenate/arsenite/antimonite-responsive transcriptional repressor